jgi:hypothetical protein
MNQIQEQLDIISQTGSAEMTTFTWG